MPDLMDAPAPVSAPTQADAAPVAPVAPAAPPSNPLAELLGPGMVHITSYEGGGRAQEPQTVAGQDVQAGQGAQDPAVSAPATPAASPEPPQYHVAAHDGRVVSFTDANQAEAFRQLDQLARRQQAELRRMQSQQAVSGPIDAQPAAPAAQTVQNGSQPPNAGLLERVKGRLAALNLDDETAGIGAAIADTIAQELEGRFAALKPVIETVEQSRQRAEAEQKLAGFASEASGILQEAPQTISGDAERILRYCAAQYQAGSSDPEIERVLSGFHSGNMLPLFGAVQRLSESRRQQQQPGGGAPVVPGGQPPPAGTGQQVRQAIPPTLAIRPSGPTSNGSTGVPGAGVARTMAQAWQQVALQSRM